jgi:hypothetical protein
MNATTARKYFILLFFTVLASLATQKITAQCSSSGARSGTVFSSDGTVFSDYPYSSPVNASASDNVRALGSATLSLLTGNTDYLKATGFGFSIPVTASICGIVVEVEKSASGINIFATVSDNSVRLIKNGTITGSNYATGTTWTSTDAYEMYGGISNLWGTTWSPADINSANFGLAFSAGIHGLIALLPSARIDHVRITVHYFNMILPLTLLNFSALTQNDHSAKIQWTTANNDEVAAFGIQRKIAGSDWQTLSTQSSEINQNNKAYQYTDANCTTNTAFYRLQIKHASGSISYSEIAPVKWNQDRMMVYPNPATDYLFIQSKQIPQTITCTGIDGRNWKLNYKQNGSGLYKVNISALPRGTYIATINEEKKLFIKE